MNLSDVIASSQVEKSAEPLVRLIIDGDIVAYRAAAVTDGRMYTLKGDPDQAWKYKADIMTHCVDRGIDVSLIELSFFPEPVVNATKIVQQIMSGIVFQLKTRFPNTELVVYLTGSTNFRDQINPQYKGNRKDLRRPANLKACKKFLVDNYAAEEEHLLEADDMMTILATELGSGNCVICSVDKDLKQQEGLHYNFVDDELTEVSYAEGRRLLWQQVISGDSTDNIHSPRGLGKVAGVNCYKNVDMDTATDESLFELATMCYSAKMKKTLDHSDIRCFVEQVYHQVYLLRNRRELDAYKAQETTQL